ncbi:MAG: ABC transporter permease [Bacteroidota bacterium]
MKEVGVRKSIGAARSQLINQFMSESVILSIVALLIGIVLTQIALPYLNSFTEKQIPANVLLNPMAMGTIISFALIVGVTAGAYPALYISSFKPSSILSGRGQNTDFRRDRAPQRTRGCSIHPIVLHDHRSDCRFRSAHVHANEGCWLRRRQCDRDTDPRALDGNGQVAKNEFSNHPNVLSATLGYGLPGQAFAGDGFRDKETGKEWQVSMLTADEDYVKTLGLDIIAGRDFHTTAHRM